VRGHRDLSRGCIAEGRGAIPLNEVAEGMEVDRKAGVGVAAAVTSVVIAVAAGAAIFLGVSLARL
jgi:hypothetical protein